MFGVVIPAYNCENTIERALDSVLNQTRFDLIDEIIIVNDGSTDKTDKVINSYINNKNCDCIKYIVQENHGVSYTRNIGIKMSTSEWIALLDSDDIWLQEKIEKQYDIIQNTDDIFFLGAAQDYKQVFKKMNGLVKLNAKQLCIRNIPSTPSVVFDRKKGLEFGLFDENMKYGEDINFFQKFILLDSYYVMIEKMIEISIGKDFFAQTGLSSNLKMMHKGRNKNTKDLYEMGLISKKYLYLMLFLNELKYIRRRIEHVYYLIRMKK